MKNLPIDTSSMTLMCSAAPVPVLDFESKRHRADENGLPLYSVELVALRDGGAEILSVKVSGSLPDAVRQGAVVTVSGLTASVWSMGDRSGVSFKAAKIQPGEPASSGPSASPSGSERQGKSA